MVIPLILLAVLLVVAAIGVAGVLLVATAVVSVASRREDGAHSMAGRAPGRIARVARSLLAFDARGISAPSSRRAGAGPRTGHRVGGVGASLEEASQEETRRQETRQEETRRHLTGPGSAEPDGRTADHRVLARN